MPCAPLASGIADPSPFVGHSDEWMWHDEPTRSMSYFAMNETDCPWSAAISFTPFL